MKTININRIVLIISILLAIGGGCNVFSQSEVGVDRPNILFILLDDLGKEWISCYGAEDIETPNIDELAQSGMQFENYYTMPQCTPTRVTFMTGQYPFRHGWVNHWDVPRWGGGAHFDARRNPSIARVMKEAGYKTAVAGKWQINDFRVQPSVMIDHGFDDYCMWTGYEAGNQPSERRYWDPYIHTKEGSKTYDGQFGEDVFSDFLIDFMKRNKEEPMFLYYAMCLPHAPFVTTPLEPKVEGKLERHKAMVRYADYIVKKMTDALDQLGLREQTLVIVTSDNGSTGSIYGTRNGMRVKGGKGKTIEAGASIPFVVSQPGVVPAGSSSNTPVNISDMMATFAELAGTRPDPNYSYDSYSAASVFMGKSKEGPRKYNLSMGGGNLAKLTDNGVENMYVFRDRVVRNERFKIYIDTERRPVKLFDLLSDPWEQKNLINSAKLDQEIEKLFSYIAYQPSQDNDPIYYKLDPESWDVEVSAKSQIWKTGHPVEQPLLSD